MKREWGGKWREESEVGDKGKGEREGKRIEKRGGRREGEESREEKE